MSFSCLAITSSNKASRLALSCGLEEENRSVNNLSKRCHMPSLLKNQALESSLMALKKIFFLFTIAEAWKKQMFLS